MDSTSSPQAEAATTDVRSFWMGVALGLKDELVIRGNRIDELEAQLKATHVDERMQELVKAAQEAWTIWDHRPALILGDKVNPRSREWMMEQRKAMNNLGAALVLVGADLRTPKEGEGE